MTRKGYAEYARKFEEDVDDDSPYFWEGESEATAFAFDLAFAIWAYCSQHHEGQPSMLYSMLGELSREPIKFSPGFTVQSEISDGPAEGEEERYEHYTAHLIYDSFHSDYDVAQAMRALRWFCSGPYSEGPNSEWIKGTWCYDAMAHAVVDDKHRNVALLCPGKDFIEADVNATGKLIAGAKMLYAAAQKLLRDLSQGEIINGDCADEDKHDDVILLENAIAFCTGERAATADLNQLVKNIEERS